MLGIEPFVIRPKVLGHHGPALTDFFSAGAREGEPPAVTDAVSVFRSVRRRKAASGHIGVNKFVSGHDCWNFLPLQQEGQKPPPPNFSGRRVQVHPIFMVHEPAVGFLGLGLQRESPAAILERAALVGGPSEAVTVMLALAKRAVLGGYRESPVARAVTFGGFSHA